MALTTCDRCRKFWVTEAEAPEEKCPGCRGEARKATPGEAVAHVLKEKRERGNPRKATDAEASQPPA
jgi:PHP family Zn ribbon phosphoesterase